MKTNSDKWQVTSDPQPRPVRRAEAFARHAARVAHPSETGIALVITLILLAVTLVMAVAFLALARRERNAVNTSTDTAVTRLATDSALAAAQAQIVANLLAASSPYNYGLLVSTNYLPTFPYDPFNVGNILPRPPVYVPTNGGYDFRFYLDLNRNGQDDPNGLVPNVDNAGNTNGSILEVGDPEWIGVLEHPDQPPGPNNHFVARYAFGALPAGNTLDLNYIHNQTLNPSLAPATDGFFRNESVGSWELNLAAFLADLNTNQWNTVFSPYNYSRWFNNNFNGGGAFNDALSLLSWRYAYNYSSLVAPPFSLYSAILGSGVDAYNLGGLMTNTFLPVPNPPGGPSAPWAGSSSANQFFALPSDLFDPTKSSSGFTNRLMSAGNSPATYDRYTFYQLLNQLGTDSTADDGRMDVNYRNITNGVVVSGMETNCYPWDPLEFFLNAANRLLTNATTTWLAADYTAYTNTFGASVTTAFGVGNIPVYVNGQFVYTPAVNRLLQLAANMYDATTTSRFPSVFRPVFTRIPDGANQNVFIIGYNQITNVTTATINTDPANPLYHPFSLPDIAATMATGVPNYINIYGVPWIIGAKKGFPNFNEFAMENTFTVTRRLNITRAINGGTSVLTGTNQMYMISLNSSLGVELWNSYTNYYPGNITVGLNEIAWMSITNDDPGFAQHPGIAQPIPFSTNGLYAINNWPGSGTRLASGYANPGSFMVASFAGPTLTNAVYRSPFANSLTMPPGLVAPCLIPTNYFAYLGLPLLFEANSPNGFHFPQFGVTLTNRLQVYMIDTTTTPNHVIDYVSFAGPDGGFNVNSNLADTDASLVGASYGVWNMNYPAGSSGPNGVTLGIQSQIQASKTGNVPGEDGPWNADPEAVPLGGTAWQQAGYFSAFMKGTTYAGRPIPLLSIQAPYSPTRSVVQYFSWQANDPLVHYLASDIAAPPPVPNNSTIPQLGVNHYNPNQVLLPLTSLNLGQLNEKYMPWGGNPVYGNARGAVNYDTINATNFLVKDPLIYQSDNWAFPAGKLPTVGWLGRVHRGTPWQTVYLKASDTVAGDGGADWQKWTGNTNQFDAVNAAPISDSRLFDLFTAAPNPNATHGTLSVNQTGLAAWSAVFSGLVVPDNTNGGYVVISPAGPAGLNGSALGALVANINNTRANFKNADGLTGAFEHVGDILRTPALTEQSPFLAGLIPASQISDALYEWLPQQTLGLLRVSSLPRYVIYCYGQTLRPAPNGVVTSSGGFGLVTNYQITAESAARAVVHVNQTVVTNAVGVATNYSTVIENYTVLPPQ